VKVFALSLAILLAASFCFADTVKGVIEKVDIKNYEMTVSGKKVKILTATVYTDNEVNLTKNVIVRDLKDHIGEKAVCYGSFDKEGVLDAYKVRVKEGHK
jgi:hypothetical protein